MGNSFRNRRTMKTIKVRLPITLATGKTIKLHVTQLPETVTPKEITFRDVIDHEIILTTFSGDGSYFIRAEIYEDDCPFNPQDQEDWTPGIRSLKLRDAVPLLQSIERHGDWWNPNTERFLGFWINA
jgi:hypothetical protein